MKKQFDLTTDGILQKLVFVAMPIMGTQLMQMLYNLTDMFWLGRLSPEAVAATGVSGMYMWLGMALLLIGRMGAEIGVSQYKGRGNLEVAGAFARNALLLAMGFGIVYGLALIFFSEAMLAVFNIREDSVADMAADYLRIIGLGIPATYMAAALTGSFNGSGNSQIPFRANVIGLTISVALNPLLIFTLGFGVRGAAASTALAQWIVFGLLLWAIKKHKDRPFERIKLLAKPNPYIMRQIMRWAMPVSLESGFFTILTMAVTRLTAGFGSDALAVTRVASQIESLSWLIGGGFGTAVTAFIGQNFGAGKWDRINRGFYISSLTMLIWGAVVSLMLFFGGYIMFGLFISEEEIVAMGVVFLRILAITQIPACLEAAGAGLFRGMGRTISPSVVSIVSNVLRVPACYLLAATSLGLHGIWWGVTLSAVFRGSVIFVWALIVLLEKKRKVPLIDTGIGADHYNRKCS